MSKYIDFYFDFISPYSYIAHKKIRQIEKKQNVKFKYKPILLGGLHNLSGITAPAFIKKKSKFIVRDCNMVAKKSNISFKFNPKFPINSLDLMRGVLTIKPRQKKIYIDRSAYKLVRPRNTLKNLSVLLSNISEVFKKLEEQGIDPVLWGLTDKDFELLAKNFARIRNQLKITNDLLDKYKEYYETDVNEKQ